MNRKLLTITLMLTLTINLSAQRTTDKLDRGLVAVPATTGGGNISRYQTTPTPAEQPPANTKWLL